MIWWHDVTWRGMAWHDATWRDMTWHGVTWHDVTWRDMTWHDVTWRDMTRQDVKWRYMTWHDVTWRDMTWHDVTWRDIMWNDVKWCSMTWHDVTWRDMTIKLTIKHWSCDHHASFRAIAYTLRAFLSRNECLGYFKNLLNRKVTWIFEVLQTWWLRRNVSKVFPDLKNINSEEISKLDKTQSPVPPSTC